MERWLMIMALWWPAALMPGDGVSAEDQAAAEGRPAVEGQAAAQDRTVASPAENPAVASPAAPRPLATYRAEISERDLASWRAQLSAEAGLDREQAIEAMVLTRAFAAEALRLGLDQRPDVRVELLQVRGQRAMQALRRHVSASITVSEAEVAAEVDALEGKVGLPRRIRLRNLFKRVPPDATGAEKAVIHDAMMALRQRVLDGEDFAALATAESDSPTRQRGGLLGNVRAGTLRPSVERVAWTLRAGEVSAVLEEQEGFTLLYCERVLEAVVRTPGEIREIARQRLENQAWRRDWTAMEAHLLARADADWQWSALMPEPGPIDPDAVLVTFRGDRLTVGETHALLAPHAALAALAARPREQLMRHAEPFLRGQMAVREVVTRGLDSEASDAGATWTVERVLAAKATAELVSRRLEVPTDAEADALIRDHPTRFQRPEQVVLQLITLPFEATDPRPAYVLAEQIMTRLGAGEATFGELARLYSAHPSAEERGRIPAIPRHGVAGRIGIEAARALKRLAPGERSGWVQDDERGQLWLIELVAIEPPRALESAEARGRARQILGQARAEALADTVSREWLERLELRVSDEP